MARSSHCQPSTYSSSANAEDPIDSLVNAPLAASDRDAVDDAIAEPDPAAELRRLKQLICAPAPYNAPWARKKTLRPDLSDEDKLSGNPVVDDILTSVAKAMRDAIRRTPHRTADRLVESMRLPPVERRSHERAERVIEAVGAILFAEEWASGSAKASGAAPEDTPVDVTVPVTIPSYSNLCKADAGLDVGCRYVFELMLRIDYGFPDYQLIGPRLPVPGIQDYFWETSWLAVSYFADFLVATARRWRQGHVPDRKAWDHITLMLEQYEEIQVHIWDVATLFYYFHTHRRPVDPEDYKRGWAGYTGVLQEMIAEVPARGTDRLARKLSLDVCVLIPRFVWGSDQRAKMIAIARHLALQHGIEPPVPEQEGWFGSLVGLFTRGWGGGKEKEA